MRELAGNDDFLGLERRDNGRPCTFVGPHVSVVRELCVVTHGGDPAVLHLKPGEFIDASASINPLGPPTWLRQEIERSIPVLCHYPDPTCNALRMAIALHNNARREQVVIGNGSSELITWLPLVAQPERWLIPVPSYGEYRRSAALAHRQIAAIAIGAAPDFALDWNRLELEIRGPSVVLLGHPNNPTGTPLDVERLHWLRRRQPDTLFVVDEAFIDFCSEHSTCWRCDAKNLLVLRSLTKCLAIAGLRLGYALGNADLVAALQARLPPWSVNLLAQRIGERYFAEPQAAARMRRALAPLKAQLVDGLRELAGCRVVEGAANWVLLDVTRTGFVATEVADFCRKRRVALRACNDFVNLDGQWLRISVRGHEDNTKILRVLTELLGPVDHASSECATS